MEQTIKEDPETGEISVPDNSSSHPYLMEDKKKDATATATATATTTANNDSSSNQQDDHVSKIPWYRFENKVRARGFNTLGMARGALVMSNIFLASSLIWLASEEAGCLNEEGDSVDDDCENKVYGFKPASLISNIAVICGVLSALFMPLFGAMVDYTPHRRLFGIGVAVLMLLIQAVQIATTAQTWFAMAILQAVSGLLYQFEVLATYAYLPEMCREVGEEIMTGFSSVFTMCQFGSQVSFLFLVIVVSIALGLDDVQTAQVSQGINAVWAGVAFAIGWRLMPNAPASHELPQGTNLLTAGFVKNINTAKLIHQKYSDGLQWYLLALIFAEAGINSFTTLAVIYLDEHVGLSGSEIGIFFMATLLFTIPGSKLGGYMTGRLNPKRSYRLSLICLIFVTAGGAAMVDRSPQIVTFVWACIIGVFVGWYYPTENLFFSMIVPKGQEAELAGFFVYCTQILVWAPPLIFTVLVESDISQTYGVMSLSVFFFIAIVLVSMAAPWEEIVASSSSSSSCEENNNNGSSSDINRNAGVLVDQIRTA